MYCNFNASEWFWKIGIPVKSKKLNICSHLILDKFESWDKFAANPRQKAWNRATKWLSLSSYYDSTSSNTISFESPLHLAAVSGHLENSQCLKGNDYGETPLH